MKIFKIEYEDDVDLLEEAIRQYRSRIVRTGFLIAYDEDTEELKIEVDGRWSPPIGELRQG